MKSLLSRFIKNESGATAIEYGLIAAGLAVIVILVFGKDGVVQEALNAAFAKVTTAIKT
ncbi:Flp family type IVb pilin [Microvirga aerilata]|uniref:Flp family type IVb pilin n=1 Tax=Microvirga aerilata TaxID=670292 RepID=A0A937D137_9HYPH|nr:Flp family type IVb pilin [Microvirga aerilata]MBL0406546.1 Flp family type IVb pilin [Microvirga aerilata]